MHGALALLPVALLATATAAEGVAALGWHPGARDWARVLMGAGLVAALLTAFTGLDARKSLPSEGSAAMAGVDRHVLWAIVLLLPLIGVAVYRLRMKHARADRRPWLPVALDAVAATLALSILWMGAGSR